MFTTRRGFLVFTILFATVARPVAVTAQSPPEMRSSIGSPQRCHDVDPVHLARGPVDRFDRSFAGSEVLPPIESCDEGALTEVSDAVRALGYGETGGAETPPGTEGP